jgi:osmotically-inducible protein OsmY
MYTHNEVLEELTERLHCIVQPDTINIEMAGNIAILSGSVPSQQKKNEVAMTAAYVVGVEGLENRLTICTPDHIL